MKAALQAKRQYVMATALADGTGVAAPAPVSAATRAGGASASSAATSRTAASALDSSSAAPAAGAAAAAAPTGVEGWESDNESGSVAASVIGNEDAAGLPYDAAGALPAGWTAHKDAEGDTWYFNASTQVSSWTRPS